MKQTFSNKWKSSVQTRKQRKYRANAPLHVLRKFMGAHLSKDLKNKYKTRSLSVRKGDDVKVMRGKFKGQSGKISLVDIKKGRVTIDGLQNKKKDGTKINAFFNPSNLLIQNLELGDKKRMKRISRLKSTKGTSDKSEASPKKKEIKKEKKEEGVKKEDSKEKVEEKK